MRSRKAQSPLNASADHGAVNLQAKSEGEVASLDRPRQSSRAHDDRMTILNVRLAIKRQPCDRAAKVIASRPKPA